MAQAMTRFENQPVMRILGWSVSGQDGGGVLPKAANRCEDELTPRTAVIDDCPLLPACLTAPLSNCATSIIHLLQRTMCINSDNDRCTVLLLNSLKHCGCDKIYTIHLRYFTMSKQLVQSI